MRIFDYNFCKIVAELSADNRSVRQLNIDVCSVADNVLFLLLSILTIDWWGILYLVPTRWGTWKILHIVLCAYWRKPIWYWRRTRVRRVFCWSIFEIKNAMLSYHKFNEHQTVSSVVSRLKCRRDGGGRIRCRHRVFPIPVFCGAWSRKGRCGRICLPGATRLLYRLWSLLGLPFLRPFLLLKVFFRSRKAGPPVWRLCLQNPGPFVFMNRLTVWSRRWRSSLKLSGRSAKLPCAEISKVHEESVRGTLKRCWFISQKRKLRGEPASSC